MHRSSWSVANETEKWVPVQVLLYPAVYNICIFCLKSFIISSDAKLSVSLWDCFASAYLLSSTFLFPQFFSLKKILFFGKKT